MRKTADSWNGGEAARIVGCGYWQLYEWDRSGLLKPSKRVGTGHATRRLYTWPDLVAARTLVRLKGTGLSTQILRKAVSKLRAKGVRLDSVNLAVAGGEVYVELGDDWLVGLVKRPGQVASEAILFSPVAADVRELRERIENEAKKPERPKSGRRGKAA